MHTCHHPNCKTEVPPRMFGCRPHWYALPRRIRNRIWDEYVPGQEVRKDPTAGYLDAAGEAVQWWMDNEK